MPQCSQGNILLFPDVEMLVGWLVGWLVALCVAGRLGRWWFGVGFSLLSLEWSGGGSVGRSPSAH